MAMREGVSSSHLSESRVKILQFLGLLAEICQGILEYLIDIISLCQVKSIVEQFFSLHSIILKKSLLHRLGEEMILPPSPSPPPLPANIYEVYSNPNVDTLSIS